MLLFCGAIQVKINLLWNQRLILKKPLKGAVISDKNFQSGRQIQFALAGKKPVLHFTISRLQGSEYRDLPGGLQGFANLS